MSRPVLIFNGSNKVKDFSGMGSCARIGNSYHFTPDRVHTFNLTSEDIGGIVTYKGNPFGVVGVPASITGDGSIRIMSIALMAIKNLKYGDTSGNPNSTIGSLMNCCTRYDNYGSTNPPLNSYISNYKLSLPTTINSSNFVDGWARHKIWIQITDEKNTLPNWRTISELTKLSASASQNRGYSDSNICCWRYSPIDELDTTGYWYTPSGLELKVEANNKSIINQSFSTIKTLYDIGIGRIPYIENGSDGFMTGDYGYSTWYGGAVGKYSIYNNSSTSNFASVQDGNTVQAWCKLIKDKGHWILDPTYHID